ncbi:MAG: hypothetical protein LBE31_10935, partial [Deltaproteobacteria bacterium]|nr:hypothetical protein [Deltaproteobacteria bacterium]
RRQRVHGGSVERDAALPAVTVKRHFAAIAVFVRESADSPLLRSHRRFVGGRRAAVCRREFFAHKMFLSAAGCPFPGNARRKRDVQMCCKWAAAL